MRRASFVAPLLLIGIGVVFLIRNIYPDIPLLEYLSRFWPWLLIAWGALRVVEVVLWKAQERPLPPSGVSGGEWLLILFICVFGGGLHAAHGFANGNWPGQIRVDGMDFFGEPFEYPVDVQKISAPNAHIILENFRGDARISGGDNAILKVTGKRIVRTMRREEAERANTASTIEITGDAGNLVIRTSQESRGDARRVTYNLEIAVPKGAQVEIRGQGGDLNVEDLAGVVLNSERGDVRLKNISGPSTINLRRGDVHIEAAHLAGQMEVSSGDVEASDLSGPVKISARSGDIKISRVTGALDVDVTRGDLELNPGAITGPIHAHSRSGDISLALPPSAQFSVEASTSNGDVSNDFSSVKTDTNGRRGSLHGTVGTGPSVDLRTERGDIALRKASDVDGKRTPAKPLEKVEQ
jgi:hypothetical protein